jgi:dolichol-phosphate mannosyltransferase
MVPTVSGMNRVLGLSSGRRKGLQRGGQLKFAAGRQVARAPFNSMITIVLPAYNEEVGLPGMLADIASTMRMDQLDYRVIVVNDGSTDATAEVTACARGGDLPLRQLDHDVNKGLGAALSTGLRAALEDGRTSVIVTMDADDTHSPSCIGELVAEIVRGSDVAIASRFTHRATAAGVPVVRRVLSHCSNTLFSMAYPDVGIRDFTSGFRAYRASTVERAFHVFGDRLLSDAGFACTPGLLVALSQLGARCSEIPISLNYGRKSGPSKLPALETIVASLKLLRRAGEMYAIREEDAP